MVLENLNTFLTAAIAFLAVVIAWKQHRTEAMRLRFDMFDRRVTVYKKLDDILFFLRQGQTQVNGKTAQLLLQELSSESNFLFSKDIGDYLEELRQKAISLESAQKEINGIEGRNDADVRREELAQEEMCLKKDFSEKKEELYEKFSSYLTIEQPSCITK